MSGGSISAKNSGCSRGRIRHPVPSRGHACRRVDPSAASHRTAGIRAAAGSPPFKLAESSGIQVRRNRISKNRTNRSVAADMALSQKLLIRQSQALVMTPQLMQAIKLLQLSHLDLAAYVDGELERNPLLERPAEEEPVRGEAEPARRARPATDGGAPQRRLDGRSPGDQPRDHRATARHRPRKCLSRREPGGPGAAKPNRNLPPIPNGPASVPAVAPTATIISRPSSPRRPRSPAISPNRWRSPSPIRSSA